MRSLAWLMAAALTLTAFGLAGCAERDQVVVYKQGEYQGKPDQLPWNNAPPAWGNAKWTKGDEASWEQEVKTRTLGQNEYVRIVH